MAEGVRLFTGNGKNEYVVDGFGHYRSIGCTLFDTPKEAFAALIDKTSGIGNLKNKIRAYEIKEEEQNCRCESCIPDAGSVNICNE